MTFTSYKKRHPPYIFTTQLAAQQTLAKQVEELKKEIQQMKGKINYIIHFLNPQTESPYGHSDYVDNFVGSVYACDIEVSPPSDT